ncbi:TRAP transporter small permease [Algihabitans albus]|uniref:TRAP transporter small permease n=1 Tax=Algihabitans albus TaxID=2164067 RepID=UPI000E5D664E|nr:TRAP transporter small permease subunit [Algihabitans albus]
MRIVTAISEGVSRLERALLIALTLVITLLILVNVVTRAFDVAIYWVDELAIYCLIWLVFIGGSHTLRLGRQVRVTAALLAVPPSLRTTLLVAIDAAVFAFSLLLVWMAWIWFDLPGLAAAGFDTDAFAGTTFNFIYDEPTLTIGIDKFWIWLVMPWFAVTASVHAAANLLERLSGRASVEVF